jgi:hypothetical protein
MLPVWLTPRALLAGALLAALVATGVLAWRAGAAHEAGKAAKRDQAALQAALKARDEALTQRNEIDAQRIALATHLATLHAENDHAHQQTGAEIARLAGQKQALSAQLVGLLNARSADRLQQPAPGDPGAPSAQTPPAGGSAAADAPALAASERDVALWINTAQQLYERCAVRLAGWQQWWTALPDPLK